MIEEGILGDKPSAPTQEEIEKHCHDKCCGFAACEEESVKRDKLAKKDLEYPGLQLIICKKG